MRHRCRRTNALLIAAALVVGGAAACSGDDGDDSAADAPGAAARADGEGSGDAADALGTTTLTTEPDVSGIERDDDFCEGWLEAEEAFDTDQFDPATLDDMLPVLRDLTEKAPSELEDEMTLLTEAFSRALPFFEEMTRLNEEALRDPSRRESISEELDRLSDEVDVFSTPEFQDATARVSAYAEQKCGAEPD